MTASRPSQRLVPSTEASSSAALVEHVATWVLKGPLTLALLGLCGFQLATWLPHYLTWPWFADHDVFATLALGWEHGQLPYRDLLGNNFPGTVYLFWIVGKAFGWGKTLPFLAVDAAFLLSLGATLFVWSQRRFGRLLPAVVAYAVFLSYYLNLDFSRVAQRDWHGPFFVVVGLLLTDAYPGKWSRRLAAVTTAIGFTIRPQIVLLLPAVMLAVAQGTRPEPEASNKRTFRILLGWSALLAALIVVGFLPLVWSGIWDDFLRGVGITFYGGSYNKASPRSILTQMMLQALHLEFLIAPAAVLVLAPLGDARTRSTAWIWLLAYLGVWFYKPMSPVPFPYLEHPLTLVWAVTIGVLVQLLLTPGLAHPAIRLAAVLVAMRLGVHARPGQCSVSYAREGLATLQRGTDPDKAPLGIHIALPTDSKSTAFPWSDYRETLAYLRTEIDPSTRVANLLHVVPALNGPSGRLTPLPAESLAWLGVHPDDEPAFHRALERADANSVVVWTPDMGKFKDLWSHYDDVERLAPVIRRYYEPSARFGDVEVWRRKAEAGVDKSDRAS